MTRYGPTRSCARPALPVPTSATGGGPGDCTVPPCALPVWASGMALCVSVRGDPRDRPAHPRGRARALSQHPLPVGAPVEMHPFWPNDALLWPSAERAEAAPAGVHESLRHRYNDTGLSPSVTAIRWRKRSPARSRSCPEPTPIGGATESGSSPGAGAGGEQPSPDLRRARSGSGIGFRRAGRGGPQSRRCRRTLWGRCRSAVAQSRQQDRESRWRHARVMKVGARVTGSDRPDELGARGEGMSVKTAMPAWANIVRCDLRGPRGRRQGHALPAMADQGAPGFSPQSASAAR